MARASWQDNRAWIIAWVSKRGRCTSLISRRPSASVARVHVVEPCPCSTATARTAPARTTVPPSGQCHPTNRFFCPCRIALVRSFPSFLTSQTRRRFRTYSALSAIVAKTSRRVSGKTNGDTETIYCGLSGLDEKEQQHHDIYSILLSRPLSLSLLFSRAFPRPRRRVGLLEPTAIC